MSTQQDALRRLIADDAHAASFQSLGGYRKALLAALASPPAEAPAGQGERERFETWAESHMYEVFRTEDEPPMYYANDTHEVWQAWQAALAQPVQAPAVPEGYAIVPIEPTEAMIQAGCMSQSTEKFDSYRAWWNSHSSGVSERIRDLLIKDYLAMIAAAPTAQPKQESEE